MIKHCEYWERWIQGDGEFNYKQSILGILLGKWMLHRTLKNEKPLAKNIPTSEPFVVREKSGDLEASKQQWIDRIASYASFSNPSFVHDFFGKMTDDQIGKFAYKHTDHHLRQFGG